MGEWVHKKVSDLGRIITGKTPKTAIAENYGGTIPFLTPSDDMSVKHVTRTGKTITKKGLSEVKNCLLPAQSVCVSCIGSDLGKVVMTTEPTVTNQQINSIIVNTELFDSDFVYYAMCILGKKLNFIGRTSTTVPIVNKSSFSACEIQCPSLVEQQQIAAILSAIDAKIAVNSEINDNLLQQLMSIYCCNYLTRQPNGTIEAILAENPKSSVKVRDARLHKVGYPFYTSGKSILLYDSYMVDGRNIFLNTGGNADVKYYIGKAAYSTDTWCISGTENYSDYLYIVLKYLLPEIESNYFEGSTLKHLQKNKLRQHLIYIPSTTEINNFNSLANPIFDLISANMEENKQLKEMRNLLLPKLISGEIDVSDIRF